MEDTADFTRNAAAMVARNDRRAWLRGVRVALRRASRRALVLWGGTALAATAIYVAPPYARFYS